MRFQLCCAYLPPIPPPHIPASGYARTHICFLYTLRLWVSAFLSWVVIWEKQMELKWRTESGRLGGGGEKEKKVPLKWLNVINLSVESVSHFPSTRKYNRKFFCSLAFASDWRVCVLRTLRSTLYTISVLNFVWECTNGKNLRRAHAVMRV